MLGLLVFSAQAGADPADGDAYYKGEDAQRMGFTAAFHAAHVAELKADCVKDKATLQRLSSELATISTSAQRRNPDVDLSTFEGQTGYDVSRPTLGQIEEGCETSDEIAVANFTSALKNLRMFTKKWR